VKAEIAEVKGSKHGAGKKIRTLLSMMLVLLLAGLFVCAPTMQAQAEETGTVTTPTITPVEPTYENDAWQIGTAAELYWFAEYVNGTRTTTRENVTTNAVLTANIVINNVDMLNADGTLKADASNLVTWVPIGNSTKIDGSTYQPNRAYGGTFDGQGYSISGLYYSPIADTVTGGLFGSVTGTVKRVSLVNSYIEGDGIGDVGGICGYVRGGTILACYNGATVEGSGICDGFVNGTISYCYNAGKVSDNGISGATGNGLYLTAKLSFCVTENGGICRALSAGNSISETYVGVTAERLASGEIAYILNGKVSADEDGAVLYWYQNLESDKAPVLDATHGKIYEDAACENNKVWRLYTNADRTPQHEYTENGVLCDYCHDINPDKLAELVEDDVWQIDSAEDLYYFADYFNNYVYYESEGDTTSGDPQYVDAILLADIDLNVAMAEVDLTSVNTSGVLADTEGNAVDTSAWKQWTPIGKNRTYTGTFDGNGHVISHLFINQPESSGLALVCSGGDATVVKNLGIRDSFICGEQYLGSIMIGAGSVSNCFSNSTIVTTSWQYQSSYNPINAAGIAPTATVSSSYYDGIIYRNASSGSGDIGGINVYHVGGNVVECFTTGKMYGYKDGIELNGSDASWQVTEVIDTQVTDGSLAHMLQQICLEGEQYWSQGAAGYPVPVAGEAITHTYDETTQFCCCGAHKLDANIPASYFENAPDMDGNSVYQISNAEELYWFAGLVNGDKRVCKDGVEQNRAANAVLTADITVNSKVLQDDMTTVVEETSSLIPWIPIGWYEYVSGTGLNEAYTGTFDGQGHSISGLYLPYDKYEYAGLFGAIYSTGTVQQVILKDSYFYGTYSGGICGYNYSGKIIACYSDAMTAGGNAGGLCGRLYGTMSNCYYAGKCDYAVGYGDMNHTIRHCVCTGEWRRSRYDVSSNVYQYIINSISNVAGENPTCVNGCFLGTVPTTYTIATEDILTSGELTYILNGEVSAHAEDATLYWYQKIGKDSMPILIASNAPEDSKVYATTICPGRPNLKFANEAMEAGKHVYEDGFFCKFCDELNEEGTFLSEEGTWQIGDADTLYAFVKYVNKSDKNGNYINAVLTADVDLNPSMNMTLNADGTLVTTEGLTQWVSIGSSAVPYKGTFDGKGHSIYHLYLNNDTDYAMFEECSSAAVICNLGLQDSYIANTKYVMIASFSAKSGTVKNCFSTAVLKGRGDYYSNSYYGTSSDSRLYGITAGTAENCYFAGKIYTTNGTQVYGGSTASSSYTINCYSTDERYYNGEKITTKDLCTVMTAEQITNGALAHALQMGSDENTWSQGEDYPVPVAGEKLDHTFSTETGFCLCGATKWDKNLTEDYFADVPEQVNGVYQISNAVELFWFAGLVNGDERVCTNGVTKNRSAKAVLTNDIIINGEASILNANRDGLDVSYDNLVLWTPIGLSSSYSYAGTFDGQGYTISGLVQPRKDMDYTGLFGYTTGVIQNVTVTNSYIVGGLDASTSSSAYLGGICGFTDKNISKVAVTNSYIASEANAYVGGIAGWSTATITACYSDATVFSGNNYFGGLCVYVGTIQNSYYAGTSAKAVYSGNVWYCASNVEMGGSTRYCVQKLATTPESVNSYNTSYQYTLATDNLITSGELVYLLNGKVSAETENATLYWYQKIGEDAAPTLKESEEGKVYAVTACPETTTLAFFNESKVLDHTYSDGYVCDYCYRIKEDADFISEDGTTWQIGDAAGLYAFNKYMNNYCSYGTGRTLTAINVELTADIDMNPGMDLTLDETTKQLVNISGLINWTPIGKDYNNPYKGSFDGQGHVIRHLYVDTASYAGLFGYCDNSVVKIKNTGLVDSYICYNGTNSAYYTSSFSGCRGSVENCFSNAVLNGYYYLNGIVGNTGTATNCYFAGQIYGRLYNACCYSIGMQSNTNCYSTKEMYRNSNSWTKYAENSGSYGSVTVTTDQLSSGEVTYQLNGSSSEAPVWFQTLGEDTYPMLDSTHGTVYSVFKCDGTTPMYRNVNENASCVDEDGDGICDVCASGMHGVSLAGHNLVLGDLIAVNFYFELDATKDFTGAYVELSKDGGETKKVLVDEAEKNTEIAEGKTYYVFTYEVVAKEM